MKRDKMKIKHGQRVRRALRVRAKIHGTAKLPRLSVFRSLRYISAQLINDDNGKTLVAASDKGLSGNKTDKAKAVGKALATIAKEKKISRAVFDRASYRYHGRVKALADGAREAGLEL